MPGSVPLGDTPAQHEEASMSTVEVADKRQSPRRHVGHVATMKRGADIPARYVLVKDSSASGVRLQINDIRTLPNEFELFFHGNGGAAQDGKYRVIWKHGVDVGAQFVGPITGRTSGALSPSASAI
jgi:hypothetical protein